MRSHRMMPKGGRRAPDLEAELSSLSKCLLSFDMPRAGLVLGAELNKHRADGKRTQASNSW